MGAALRRLERWSLDGVGTLGFRAVGELADAIREHLELKRRRGADPAEVAREEHEALAPVTRSHRIVSAPPPVEQADAHEFAAGGVAAAEPDPAAEPDRAHEPGSEPAGEVADAGATQEFRVEHDGHWLADDE
jgi:hypothetical protein